MWAQYFQMILPTIDVKGFVLVSSLENFWKNVRRDLIHRRGFIRFSAKNTDWASSFFLLVVYMKKT